MTPPCTQSSIRRGVLVLLIVASAAASGVSSLLTPRLKSGVDERTSAL